MKTMFAFATVAFLAAQALAVPPQVGSDPLVNNPYQTKAQTFAVGVFPTAGAPVINLLIENYNPRKVSIKLRDEKGRVIATEAVSSRCRKAWFKFNLSQMNDSRYELEMSNGVNTVVKEISLETMAAPRPMPMLAVQKLVSVKQWAE